LQADNLSLATDLYEIAMAAGAHLVRTEDLLEELKD
jgi:hypothetical protein